MLSAQPVQRPLVPGLDAERVAFLRKSFSAADVNGDNQLSIREFSELAAQIGVVIQNLEFSSYDVDHNGRLSWAEFMSMFHFPPAAPELRPGPSAILPGVPQDGQFIDPEFPPSLESFLASRDPQADHVQDLVHQTDNGQIAWRRVSHVCPGAKLFDRVHPNDIAHGAVGDCWLLAGLAALSEFEGLVFHFFEEKTTSASGRYHCRIFDMSACQWNTVVIDDFIPCYATSSPAHIAGDPCCSKPVGNEIWVLLVEKALAKWMGSYARLLGAHASVPLMLLTEGGPCLCFSRRTSGQAATSAEEYMWFETELGDVHDRTSVRYVGGSVKGILDAEQLWQELIRADDANFVTCAFASTGGPPGTFVNAVNNCGIVMNHAYAVISVDEYPCDGRQWRVLKIRNPWARMPNGMSEWTGELSDRWPLWGQFPELHRELMIHGTQNHGMFWMPWHAFRMSFSDIIIARVTVPTLKLGKSEGGVMQEGLRRTGVIGKHTRQFRRGAGDMCAYMVPSAPVWVASPLDTYIRIR